MQDLQVSPGPVRATAADSAAGAGRFCGLPLSVGLTIETVLDRAFGPSSRPPLVTFINPGALHMARVRPEWRRTLDQFDLVLPDGIGIVWGWRAVRRAPLERMSFDTSSLALPVLWRCRRENRRVMLIGGSPGVAATATERLAEALPDLRLCTPLHGYMHWADLRATVLAERPDVVICGMGAPLQEMVLVRLRDDGLLNGPAFTCGGYLDQLNEGLTYYPPLIDRLNLRWLYRLSREPRRLWRRYLLEYPEYAVALAGEMLGRPASPRT